MVNCYIKTGLLQDYKAMVLLKSCHVSKMRKQKERLVMIKPASSKKPSMQLKHVQCMIKSFFMSQLYNYSILNRGGTG